MFHPGSSQTLNRKDFGVVDDGRNTIKTHNLNDARSLQNRQTVVRVEPAKEGPREERCIELLDEVKPVLAALVEGQKALVALAVKLLGDARFLTGTNL